MRNGQDTYDGALDEVLVQAFSSIAVTYTRLTIRADCLEGRCGMKAGGVAVLALSAASTHGCSDSCVWSWIDNRCGS